MIPDIVHHDLNSYPIHFEDMYKSIYGIIKYHGIRGKDGLHTYKVEIEYKNNDSVPDCWASFYYQTAGNGFMEFHRFRVTEVMENKQPFTIELARDIFDRLMSFYLKIR